MNKYRQQLEGTRRLFRIRRIRRVLAAVLFGSVVGLAAFDLALNGARLKPFFLPIDGVLPLVLVLLFIGGVANFVFRGLEMRHVKRDSQRYLMARNAISRATLVAVICAVLGIVLFAPATGRVVDGQLGDAWSGMLEPREAFVLNFTNQDPFAVVRATEGLIQVQASGTRVAFVVVSWTDPDGRRAETSTYVGPGTPFGFGIVHNEFLQYSVRIQNTNNGAIRFHISLDRTLMPELTSIVPAVLLAFAFANAAWLTYLRPLRARYGASSIYSTEYTEPVERGTRTFASYFRGPRAMAVGAGPPVARAAMPPPPPPRAPAVPLPPAPAGVESAAPPGVAEPPHPAEDADVLLAEGSRLFSEGQLDPALAKFDEALEIDPTCVAALLAGAATLSRLGRHEEALAAYGHTLEVDPRNANALKGRAELLEAQGEWRRSGEAWTAFLREVPADVEARLRLADVFVKAGERKRAIRELEDAPSFTEDPRLIARLEELRIDVPSLLSKALVASASGRLDEALALLDRILATEPDNVNALVAKGVALRRAGQADGALAALDRALAQQPNNSAALRAKGQILEDRGSHEAALDVYEVLLETSPRDAEVWALQAGVLEKLGEVDEALASYHEALRIEPGNEDWRAHAAVLEASKKGEESFLEELFTIRGVGPARVRALLGAGYRSADSLRTATEDELANVRGLTRKVAQDIYRHFHGEPPEKEEAREVL